MTPHELSHARHHPAAVSFEIIVQQHNLPPVLIRLRDASGLYGINGQGGRIEDNHAERIAAMYRDWIERRATPGPEPFIEIEADWAPALKVKGRKVKAAKSPLFAGVKE